MTATLAQLADRYGIATEYTGLDGASHAVSDHTIRVILDAMGVNPDTAALSDAPSTRQVARGGTLPRCYLPDWLKDGRGWGIALQLYAIRSERNWGIGDFGDLAGFAAQAATAGADFIGTNPLHALFLADPSRRSPFFPSNRRFLNPLYIAVDAVPGYTPDEDELATAASLRNVDLVDYAGVTALKLAALKRIWPRWQGATDNAPYYAHEAFERFCQHGGEALRLHCLYDALALEMVGRGHSGGWTSWPQGYDAPSASNVEQFAAAEADAVTFMMWLQWLASVQLRRAHEAALAAGMRIGLYLDFAVGEAPDGSATWADPVLTMRGVEVGAPPDYFSTSGQNWGLAPLSPAALVEQNLVPYESLVSASMHHGGAMRIDHAMGIEQMFIIPGGEPASTGTYIHFPLERMVETLAAASHQHKAVLIGEDLGNVPVGFRELMEEAAILSYRILYFEQHDGRFLSADEYPRNAMACLSTHDLPTIEGWWRGEDVNLRRQHELIDELAAQDQLERRHDERNSLLAVLTDAGLLSAADRQALDAAARSDSPLPDAIPIALHRFLARTPARLLAVRLEDLAGERMPVNLPGTIDAYPNWQRKLAHDMNDILGAPLFIDMTRSVAEERPRVD
tara:strand:- start:8442 stop:10313 length:1872 start_codon:yes stop_codon:yes gene_type:complete